MPERESGTQRNLAHQSLKNGVASSISYILSLLLFTVSLPFILRKLGVEWYGTWVILINLENFLGLVDLGVAPTMIRYLASYQARNLQENMIGLYSLGTIYYVIAGILVATLLILFTDRIIVIFGFPVTNEITIQNVVYLTAFDFLVRMLSNAARNVPIALQRIDWISLTESIYRVSSTLLTVCLLFAGGNIETIIVGSLVLTLLRGLMFLGLAHKLLPFLTLRVQSALSQVRMILEFNLYNAGLSLAGRSFGFADRLIVGATLGPQASSYYVTADRIASQIHSFLFEVMRFLFPLSSAMSALDQKERSYRIFLFVLKITALLAVSLAVPIIQGSYRFIELWLGGDFVKMSAPLLQVQAIAYTLAAMMIPIHYFVNGIGRPRVLGIWMVWGFCSLVVLYFLLIPELGLIGASFALAIYMAVNFTIYISYIHPFLLRYSVRDLLYSLSPAAISFIPVFLIESQFHLLFAPSNFYLLLGVMSLYAACIVSTGIIVDSVIGHSTRIHEVVRQLISILRNVPAS